MQSFVQRTFLRGQYVFTQGEPSEFIYIIKNGEFEQSKELMVSKFPKKKVFMGQELERI